MKVAITGGIGSGKSYICQRLELKGIHVYDCDAAAKRLMRTSPALQSQLSSLVGTSVFKESILQKGVLAGFLLADEAHKQAVNEVVHPFVAADFLQSGYEWLESAIYFESRFDLRVDMDKVLCVAAPKDIRMQRVMKRDGITRAQALEWIDRQMPQEEVCRLSDYIIVNDGIADVDEQIETVLSNLRI